MAKKAVKTAAKPAARKVEAKAEPKQVVTAEKKVEVVQNGKDTPEAQPTRREATEAANKQFAKADEAGKAEILAERRVTMAALGR